MAKPKKKKKQRVLRSKAGRFKKKGNPTRKRTTKRTVKRAAKRRATRRREVKKYTNPARSGPKNWIKAKAVRVVSKNGKKILEVKR